MREQLPPALIEQGVGVGRDGLARADRVQARAVVGVLDAVEGGGLEPGRDEGQDETFGKQADADSHEPGQVMASQIRQLPQLLTDLLVAVSLQLFQCFACLRNGLHSPRLPVCGREDHSGLRDLRSLRTDGPEAHAA